MSPPEKVTGLLQSWSKGDQAALDKLVPLISNDPFDHGRPLESQFQECLVATVASQRVGNIDNARTYVAKAGTVFRALQDKSGKRGLFRLYKSTRY